MVAAGAARLAGKGLIGQALQRYSESPLLQAGIQGGLDFGLNLLQGVDPITSASSALGTAGGSVVGRKLGRMVGGDAGEWAGEFIGGYAGGFGGAALPGMLKIDTTQTGEPMRSPDSAQQDPRMVQQMQMQQAMMQQGLTPEQLRKMQERAARRAAEAQYQAAALQQYGQGGQQAYGGMY
jgi:hypothetical protein